jgi:hypothetical protein
MSKKLIDWYISFFLKTTQFKVIIWSHYYWKKKLFSKILAVSIHESKAVSYCTQLLLQALQLSGSHEVYVR